MKKSEISFDEDLKEITSPNNFVVGILIPVLLAIVFNKEDVLWTIAICIGATFSVILLFFFIRWLFFYQFNKNKKKQKSRINNLENS